MENYIDPKIFVGAIIIAFVIAGAIILLIEFTSATFPGECSEVGFPNAEPVNFTLVSGDQQILDFFNWTKNGTLITYCFSKNSIIGNFTFKWSNEEEVIVNEGGSGRYSSPTIISNEQLNKGITKTIGKGQSFNFMIKEKHKFTLSDIIGNRTIIKIESNTEIFDLDIGESYIFCLDNKELKTTLINIKNNYATIKIQTLNICDIPKNEIIQGNETIPIEPKQPIPEEAPGGKEFIMILIYLSIGIFIIFISLIIYQKRKKKNEEKTDRET